MGGALFVGIVESLREALLVLICVKPLPQHAPGVGADAHRDLSATITLQPGVIGAAADRRLAPLGRKIGPDPASIDATMIGGIAANNASSMCCGTVQNSHHTLAGMRIVLADGTVLDARDPASRAARRAEPGAETRANTTLAQRIRHKFRL